MGSGQLSLRGKLALSALSLLGAVLAFEFALRLRERTVQAKMLVAHDPTEFAEGTEVSLGDILRADANDEIVYRLKPFLRSTIFKNERLSTNSHGFRSREWPLEPDLESITIVGIGDSIMFGHGVADNETFLARLEGRLTEFQPDARWRVINTAAPGYNTVMEVGLLEQVALPCRPDLVILSLVANDTMPPPYVRRDIKLFGLDQSSLARLLNGRRPSFLQHQSEWKEGGLSRDNIPERYKQTVGIENFRRAVRRLAELSEEHGFEVIVVTTYEWGKTTELVAELARYGWPYVSTMPEIVRAMEQRGQEFSEEAYLSSRFIVSRKNPHPAAGTHDMLAKKLYRHLVESKTLRRLVREKQALRQAREESR